MKNLLKYLLAIVIFFSVTGSASAYCVSTNLFSPDPAQRNVNTTFSQQAYHGDVGGVDEVTLYAPGGTSNFYVDIPGWSCVGLTCSGALYNGYFNISFDYAPTDNWIGGITMCQGGNCGQCPLGWQTVYDPTPTPVPGAVYQPDTQVMGAATELGGSLVGANLGILPVGVGIVGALTVSLFGIRKLIGWVRGNIHG